MATSDIKVSNRSNLRSKFGMMCTTSLMAHNPYAAFPQDHILRPFIRLLPMGVTPNHVTMLRMIMTPFVLFFLAREEFVIGVPLFLIAAFTDLLDGAMARVRRQITPWGILFDPIADKLLIGLVALVFALKYYHPAIVLTAVAFDLLPLLVWLMRANRPRGVMMANLWGKFKMFLQFLSILLLLLGVTLGQAGLIDLGEIVLVIATGLAAIATITYSL